MALIPFGARGVIGLATAVLQSLKSRAFLTGAATAAIQDLFNIDVINQEALKLAAPGSDPSAVRESANLVVRMLGLEGDEVLWPRNRRTGMPINPNWFCLDLQTGRAHFRTELFSSGYVRKIKQAARRGRRPFRRWSQPMNVRNG